MEEIEHETKENVALVEPPQNTTLDQTMNRMLESTISKTVQGWMTGKENNIEPGNANSSDSNILLEFISRFHFLGLFAILLLTNPSKVIKCSMFH